MRPSPDDRPRPAAKGRMVTWAQIADAIREAGTGAPRLAPTPARGPLVSLSMEAIGDDTNALMRGLGLSAPYPLWVAEITGPDPHYGLARRFLDGRKDYADANSVGSRGVYVHYALERGHLYEVQRHMSWKGGRRYLLGVTDDGEKVEMTREEALAWLDARSASTS